MEQNADMSQHLLFAFNCFAARGKATSELQPDAIIQAICALPGVRNASQYTLASEQPTPVVLGKRPGSPYNSLIIYSLDSLESVAAVSKVLQPAIAQAGGIPDTDAHSKFAYWLFRPITDMISRVYTPTINSHIHLVFTNTSPGREAEYNDWYNQEHMFHALLAHGFVTAQRFELVLDGLEPLGIRRADPCLFKYLTLYGLQTDDLRASEDDMHKYAVGEKPGMPMSDAMAPVRLSWVYTPKSAADR